MEARIFGEPLLPVGRGTLPEENRALADVIRRYLEVGNPELVLPFWAFLKQFPDSPWRASLMLNLGIVYRRTGYFSRALETWESGWSLTKSLTESRGKGIADRTVGELFELHARLGRFDRLDALFAEIEGRSILGRASEQITAAREGLWLMKNRPDQAFRCGPLAVDAILAAVRTNYRRDMRIWNSQSTTQGTSLAQMQQLASDLDMPMQMAYRAPGAVPVLPALVHWRAGHFAALIREEGGRLLVQDPTFGDEIWISRAALDDEGTGFMLIPRQPLPPAWREVSADEGATVWGKGATDGNDPRRNRDCDRQGGGCGGICLGAGMTVYSAHLMLVSLSLKDTPVGYLPARGPDMHFTVTYSQREAFQPQTFVFSHLGPKWTFDWLSYIEDDPTNPSALAHLAVRGGGRETYQGFNPATSQYQPEPLTGAVLVRTSSNPIRYERRSVNGSIEVFAQPDGAMTFPRRVFMTEWRDSAGNAVTFTCDAQLRLVAATDALGQVTTLVYEDPVDLRRLTRVTDPFGRFATFVYDTAGRLSAVTDVIGLTSSFTYDDGDFITAMTTPYGTSRFIKGENGRDRWLEMVDPTGGRERVEYRRATVMPTSLPGATVPSGPGLTFTNVYLEYRNSFYWNKRAMAVAPRDPAIAHIIHWLHAAGPLSQTSGTVESERPPLERRIWYLYPEQAHSFAEGSQHLPIVAARVLDDGTSQIWRTSYNDRSLAVSRTDPLGRRTSFSYTSNGIDLYEVRQTTGTLNDLVARYSNYTAGHRPQLITDAAGQETSVTYNEYGQILTATNAKNEVTTYTYDSITGLLMTVAGPTPDSVMAFAYDAYGRRRTATGQDGHTVTVDYDLLDRVTRITYPDGSYEETTYDKLDAVKYRDRLGRITQSFFDAERRLVARRDPLGRITTQQWCNCGTLEAIIDANGQATRWTYDVQGRVLAEQRSNGTTQSVITYEDSTSRVKQTVDAKGQVAASTYALDDSLSAVVYANTPVATPGLTLTYETGYQRLSTVTDGGGTTTYAYVPPGTLGAGRIATIDGPLANDVIAYAYDELGRVLTTTVNGQQTSRVYDTLGRVASETNALGQFTFAYDGSTARLQTVTYPNGQTSTYTYGTVLQDKRLMTIHHRRADSSTLSRFDYTHDQVGNILTWQQQVEANAPIIWEFGHDSADQLVSAVKRVLSSGAVLKRFAYGYDPAGNRTAIQVDDVVMASAYDAVNRRVSESPGGGIVLKGTVSEPATVTIDSRPARVSSNNTFDGVAQVGSGTSIVTLTATDASNNTATRNYELDAFGQTTSFIYDLNGNLTFDGTLAMEWDGENRLAAATTQGMRTAFTYDQIGRRRTVTKTLNGTGVSTKEVLWCGPYVCEERVTGQGAGTKRFFPHGIQDNGVTLFTTTDHLGSVRDVTDSSGTVRARYDYDPYGERQKLEGDLSTSVGFTGHQEEDGLGLNLAWYRAYNPRLGRWLSDDPLASSRPMIVPTESSPASDPSHYVSGNGIFSMQRVSQSSMSAYRGATFGVDELLTLGIGTNRYAYALNRPLTNRDLLGLDAWDWAACYTRCFDTLAPYFFPVMFTFMGVDSIAYDEYLWVTHGGPPNFRWIREPSWISLSHPKTWIRISRVTNVLRPIGAVWFSWGVGVSWGCMASCGLSSCNW